MENKTYKDKPLQIAKEKWLQKRRDKYILNTDTEEYKWNR